MNNLAHGSVGKREQEFSELLSLRANGYDPQQLSRLAKSMKAEVDSVKDGADPEENLWVPAGYTYLGQFVDHDLTFDSTSSLNPIDFSLPTNLRTPRFDLDCLYGDGPDAQPFMYAEDGATLLYKKGTVNQVLPSTTEPRLVEDFAAQAEEDLLRSPNGRAIIGDKRNDENSIICQIQLAFIKFHNAVVAQLKEQHPTTWNDPTSLFKSARNEVSWAYQKLLVDDFLPRIIAAKVLENLHHVTPQVRAKNYALFTADKRGNLPREFVAAAYRFGHSGVRTGYRLNANTGKLKPGRFSIFPSSEDNKPDADSLLGFEPLPQHHVIDDWGRFFRTTLPLDIPHKLGNVPADGKENTVVRLQYAYKMDTTLVDPLGVLPRKEIAGEGTTQEAEKAIADTKLPDQKVSPPRPSLALLNLLRGDVYRVQSGQEVAKALRNKGFSEAIALTPKQLSVRTRVKSELENTLFEFTQIEESLQEDTPLWFYILAEAQAPLVNTFGNGKFNEDKLLTGQGAKTQLGWVGGRIIAEVFYGLLDADKESFVHAAPHDWQPIWMKGYGQTVIFADLLKFANLTISSTH